MGRLARWIFHGLTLLSLALCLATAVLWWQSHAIDDYLGWYRTPRAFTMNAYGGCVSITWGEFASTDLPPPTG